MTKSSPYDRALSALIELKQAVEYTPLGVRGIAAVEEARSAIADCLNDKVEQRKGVNLVLPHKAGGYPVLVLDLKRLLCHWPDTNSCGEPTAVWLHRGNATSFALAAYDASHLDRTTDNRSRNISADLVLSGD